MRYLYTTKPDEGCHEVEPGIYGRPVQSCDESKLKAEGWTLTIDAQRGNTNGVRKEQKEERQESEEVTREHMVGVKSALRENYTNAMVDQIEGMQDLVERYEAKFGKKPHHKMKLETIKAKVESDD